MNAQLMFRVVVITISVGATGLAQDQRPCAPDEALRRVENVPLLHPVEPIEARVANAKALAQQVSRECIPSLIAILGDSKTTLSAKMQAARAVGILGVAFDASEAVPVLTRLIEGHEVRAFNAEETIFIFYSHVALAQIGTVDARKFLYARAKRSYWNSRTNLGAKPESSIPPQVFWQGMALQAIGYLGDNEAEDYLIEALRDSEFRETKEPYRGLDLREGDLRWKLTGSILRIHQEKKFKLLVRDALAAKK